MHALTSKTDGTHTILLIADERKLGIAAENTLTRFGAVVRARTAAAACCLFAGDRGNVIGVIADLGLVGGELIQHARARWSRASILLFGASASRAATLSSGASVVRGSPTVAAVEAFARRAVAINRIANIELIDALSAIADEWRLTDREIELLALAVADRPRASLPQELEVSANTAKGRIRSLLRKTGARNLDDVVLRLLRCALRGARAMASPQKGDAQVIHGW